MHADGVAAEAAPIGELFGLDDDVAEVDFAEDSVMRSQRESGERNSATSRLNSSARSHCIQWPVCDVITSWALGISSTDIGPPAGRFTLSSRPHSTNVDVAKCSRRRL